MQASRQDYCHPYHPYDIQLNFMSALYQCIENGQIGIFESPTGTGKSLSLICGSLTWLRDHKRSNLEVRRPGQKPDTALDWLVKAEMDRERRELLRQRQALEQKLATIREKDLSMNQLYPGNLRTVKRIKTSETKLAAVAAGSDDSFMPEEYESDNDSDANANTMSSGLSDSTRELLDKLRVPIKDEEELIPEETKIIFCSRTHSQLSQFVNELRRVRPPSSLPGDTGGDSQEDSMEESIKHLSLGSRKNLCVNSKVSHLSSAAAINEKCLELQQPGASKEQRCSFLPRKDNQGLVELFRNRALAHIQDIEDLGKLGRELHICPYYASRSAIAPSEMLTLPYPLLLQKSAREALGVSVKNNVVVIDEAHNLMGAIADTHSVSLTLQQLELATFRVTAYVQKFKNRLKDKNRVYVTQIIRLLNSITDCLRSRAKGSSAKKPEFAVSATELMAGKGVDQIRPHKLIRYLQESKLAHKVDGYAQAAESQTSSTSTKGVLRLLQNFMTVLMNPAAEGRFFVVHEDANICVRYTLLDPREHFRQIVEEARAVILAGGTMSPMSDYADYLFSFVAADRLECFSFGHVIPVTNLCVRSVVAGNSGVGFDFTFGNRGSEQIMLELGRMLERVCQVVPDGVVVFFPSYDYLSQVSDVWKKIPANKSIVDSLSRLKRIFEETKGVSTEDLLRGYSAAIDKGQGGLMLSVIGGKLSEGINFSDRLGRAVVAVGLPFPNANSAEWKAKIEHVENIRLSQLQVQRGISEYECKTRAKAAGRDFYENACMRAVNQCIGRAIRHQNDYAAILLVDERYATSRIEGKLPRWIRDGMLKEEARQGWKQIESSLQDFFRGKT